MLRAIFPEEHTMRTRLSVWTSPILCAALLAVLPACQENGQMSVKGISPQAGHVAGDQTVEIVGKNFRTDIGYTVYFGKARAKGVSIRSTESLVVLSPEGQVGPVDITVRADDGNGFVMRQAFTYQDMAGNVVANMGAAPSAAPSEKKGNLAY
ncbi:MAG: hypothetical protein RL385_3744 [Pseudomonadota bacterium]|jgi:hypothetical protein